MESIIIPSCQFYYETGRVFYGLNTFAFGGVEALVVFLIGVGRRNAMLPLSVCWGADCLYKNRADILPRPGGIDRYRQTKYLE